MTSSNSSYLHFKLLLPYHEKNNIADFADVNNVNLFAQGQIYLQRHNFCPHIYESSIAVAVKNFYYTKKAPPRLLWRRFLCALLLFLLGRMRDNPIPNNR